MASNDNITGALNSLGDFLDIDKGEFTLDDDWITFHSRGRYIRLNRDHLIGLFGPATDRRNAIHSGVQTR